MVKTIRQPAAGSLLDPLIIPALASKMVHKTKMCLKQAGVSNRPELWDEVPVEFHGLHFQGSFLSQVNTLNQLHALLRERAANLLPLPKCLTPRERLPDTKHPRAWGEDQDRFLLLGVSRHGLGNWSALLSDSSLPFQDFATHQGVSFLSERAKMLLMGIQTEHYQRTFNNQEQGSIVNK